MFGEQSRMPIGRYDNLTAVFDHLHDSVQEFFLSRPLVVQKLDIVDQQHIDVAKPLSKRRNHPGRQSGREIISERFAREIHHSFCRMLTTCFRINAFQQVRLAGARAAMNEQWIVALAGSG